MGPRSRLRTPREPWPPGRSRCGAMFPCCRGRECCPGAAGLPQIHLSATASVPATARAWGTAPRGPAGSQCPPCFPAPVELFSAVRNRRCCAGNEPFSAERKCGYRRSFWRHEALYAEEDRSGSMSGVENVLDETDSLYKHQSRAISLSFAAAQALGSEDLCILHACDGGHAVAEAAHAPYER
eukprot:scaffold1090_cov265-Pinguiococcus_pyrenoidosus.AAC.2